MVQEYFDAKRRVDKRYENDNHENLRKLGCETLCGIIALNKFGYNVTELPTLTEIREPSDDKRGTIIEYRFIGDNMVRYRQLYTTRAERGLDIVDLQEYPMQIYGVNLEHISEDQQLTLAMIVESALERYPADEVESELTKIRNAPDSPFNQRRRY